MSPSVAPSTSLLWILIAFASGSLPFSVWIGKWFLHADIRAFGDANPGATNVLRAGGRTAFAVAALLDALKAAIPVGLACFWVGVDGWPLACVAAAPLAGHAFSPFLGWHGGKAVAATFGVWAGLTLWAGPTLLGVGLIMTTRIVRGAGWAVLGAMLFMLAGLLLAPMPGGGGAPFPSPGVIRLAWLLHMAILIYTHRADLNHPPRLRRRTHLSEDTRP